MNSLGLKGKQRKNDLEKCLMVCLRNCLPVQHQYFIQANVGNTNIEYQRLLAEHNVIQSMSRKGNCMDNGAMENFFGRLKVEMFYGEKFECVNAFIDELKNTYIITTTKDFL